MSRFELRMRTGFAVLLIITGIGLISLSVGSLIFHSSLPLNSLLALGVGIVLLLAGLLLLVTELVETWLSRSQRALVDGLQAG
jgi:hypothetical protein